jgi:hypothetical protein
MYKNLAATATSATVAACFSFSLTGDPLYLSDLSDLSDLSYLRSPRGSAA